jgi:hypothetical protein
MCGDPLGRSEEKSISNSRDLPRCGVAGRMIVMKQLALDIAPFISVVYRNVSPQFQFEMKTELI